MQKKQSLFLLLLIVILGMVLRFYRISDLAVFLADQASDSQKVLEMLRGKLTLLGPITSVGGFYNGPIVYYLMLPFYFFLKGDPIAGTVFQSTLSVATIPIIYLIGRKIKNGKVGPLAGFLFAISPLMIEYSRSAFNSSPAIFFSSLIIYFFILITEEYRKWMALLLGIMIGWIVQMHYFTIAFLFLTGLYPIFFKKTRLTFSYYFFLFLGFIIGLAPFLLFEIRHQFLNTHLFIKYLVSKKTGGGRSINNSFYVWSQATGMILFGNRFAAGIIGFITIMISTLMIKIKKKAKHLSVFLLLFILVFLIGAVYNRTMHDHYIISFHTSLIILLALFLVIFFKEKTLPIVVCCLILMIFNFSGWNLTQEKHPLQKGLNILDFKKAGAIIKEDKKGVYNIAMHSQGDNRAMPLRYMLSLANEHPLDYEHYGEAQFLYFILPKNESLEKQTMWEYTSFGPSKVVKKWNLNKDYLIYLLAKDNVQ